MQYFLDRYPQNVWSFIWQSLPGGDNGNIINGPQHFDFLRGRLAAVQESCPSAHPVPSLRRVVPTSEQSILLAHRYSLLWGIERSHSEADSDWREMTDNERLEYGMRKVSIASCTNRNSHTSLEVTRLLQFAKAWLILRGQKDAGTSGKMHPLVLCL